MKVLMICGSALPEVNGGTTNVRERAHLLSSWGHTVLILAPDYSILGRDNSGDNDSHGDDNNNNSKNKNKNNINNINKNGANNNAAVECTYPRYRDDLGEVLPNVFVESYPSRHAWIDVTLFPMPLSMESMMDRIREFSPDVISVESPERLFWGFLQCVGCISRALASGDSDSKDTKNPKSCKGKFVPTFAVHHANYVAIAEGAGAAVPLLRMPGPVWFMKKVTEHVYNQFDETIVHADAAIDYLGLYGVPRSKITQCAFLGVNTRKFVPNAAASDDPSLEDLRQIRSASDNDANGGPIVFLYVGRLSDEKCVQVLIEAFRKVVSGKMISSRNGTEPLDPVLVVVGGGDKEYEAKLKTIAKGTTTLFTGPIPNDDLPGVYALCDIFVTPSPCESAGLTVLEACGCGLPVIGADAAGVGELVNDEVGRKFAPHDVDALVSSMVEVANDPALRKRLSRSAVKYAEQNSIVEATRKMVKIWTDAVEGNGKYATQNTKPNAVSPLEQVGPLLCLMGMCALSVPLLFPQSLFGLGALAVHATLTYGMYWSYTANKCCWCHAPMAHMLLSGSLAGLQIFIEVMWRSVRFLGLRKRKCWETPYMVTIKKWLGMGKQGKKID